jgi:hypothetical protein
LLIIKNNAIAQRIRCPSEISTFDINKYGNGVIVSQGFTSDIILYKVKNFQVLPHPIKATLPGVNRWTFIFDASIADDSTIRLTVNDQHRFILTDLDSLENNQYSVTDDTISSYIEREVTGYVGRSGDEYFFLDWIVNAQILVLTKESIERRMAFPFEPQYNKELIVKRTIKLDISGLAISMSNPVRIDEKAGLFYIMLVQKGNLVVYEFSIKDIVGVE